jgi:cob(I)alamin adenosyltransferase
MKIYTKTGDLGETALYGGTRVKKSHPRVNAYGTLDEANSILGLALSHLPEREYVIFERLTRVQNELFQVGAELATVEGKKNSCPLVSEVEIAMLEKEIDEMELSLAPLRNFILPGGASCGAALHLARTVVRRAERDCVELMQADPLRPEVVRYLNRLSDYLFVSARFVNHVMQKSETPWVPSKN